MSQLHKYQCKKCTENGASLPGQDTVFLRHPESAGQSKHISHASEFFPIKQISANISKSLGIILSFACKRYSRSFVGIKIWEPIHFSTSNNWQCRPQCLQIEEAIGGLCRVGEIWSHFYLHILQLCNCWWRPGLSNYWRLSPFSAEYL